MDRLVSPLTLQDNVTLIKNIPTKTIIKVYKRYNIDVSKYFLGREYVSIYRCNETNYHFYYPFNVTGDSRFYEHFQQFSWYYMPWKWEHEVAVRYIKSGDKIMEVGCAHGEFLKQINELYDLALSIGLELNQTAKENHTKIEILNETIQSYSNEHVGEFDVVCSFQVLEHITEPRSFISSSLDCLKPGGKLIVSVPNNDSYLKNLGGCLNMPPHHVGLWNETSLKSISKLFPVKVNDIHFEPLQPYHIGDFFQSKHYSSYPSILGKVIRKLHKITGVYAKRQKIILRDLQKTPGHTILVVFEKI
ncbi:MAG: methyltransferase domain-containing protein [Bacteroidales bacterium]|nr:methyltransferase domain-containing protein [Bacteroidales bacterium]